MIRCLNTQFDMLRSSLDDRPISLAVITHNHARNCVVSTQSAEHPRSRSQKMAASSASNTADRALFAKSAPPATALSP